MKQLAVMTRGNVSTFWFEDEEDALIAYVKCKEALHGGVVVEFNIPGGKASFANVTGITFGNPESDAALDVAKKVNLTLNQINESVTEYVHEALRKPTGFAQ